MLDPYTKLTLESMLRHRWHITKHRGFQSPKTRRDIPSEEKYVPIVLVLAGIGLISQ